MSNRGARTDQEFVFSARESIAGTGFAAKDVTKLQVSPISCQKSVRAMISDNIEHCNSTNENVVAILSAREAIARTGFAAEDVTKLQLACK